jgi:hypothetical protein
LADAGQRSLVNHRPAEVAADMNGRTQMAVEYLMPRFAKLRYFYA